MANTTLYAHDENGVMGRAVVDAKLNVISSTSEALTQVIGTTKARGLTVDDLDGWGNGYVMITKQPDTGWPEDVSGG